MEIKSSKTIPFKNSISTIATIYTAFLILSNLTASKVSQIMGLHFTAAIFLFPFTYIIDDILTEVYGFQISRRIIWTGLLGNLIVVFGSIFVIFLPSSEHFHNQNAFLAVFGVSLRILIASVSAYIFGEFINSIFLAKMKIYTKGRHFWARALLSTMIGAIFDTSIFMFVAFTNIYDFKMIVGMIWVEYLIKIAVEVMVLPITYKVVKYLKARDGIDVYDVNTKFNPFSMKID